MKSFLVFDFGAGSLKAAEFELIEDGGLRLKQLCGVMESTEAKSSARLRQKTGIWIERLEPVSPDSEQVADPDEESGDQPDRNRAVLELLKRYFPQLFRQGGGLPGGLGDLVSGGDGRNPSLSAAARRMATNEVSQIRLVCTAVNLQRYHPSANDNLVFDLESELTARSDYFDLNGTRFPTSLAVAEGGTTPTFSFEVTLQLKHPIKSSL